MPTAKYPFFHKQLHWHINPLTVNIIFIYNKAHKFTNAPALQYRTQWETSSSLLFLPLSQRSKFYTNNKHALLVVVASNFYKKKKKILKIKNWTNPR